jgi:hypothetical protein
LPQQQTAQGAAEKTDQTPKTPLIQERTVPNGGDVTRLIPVGGGKDSIVTLELLKEFKSNNYLYLIGQRRASLDTAITAGYQSDHVIEAQRTIDLALLELNRQGYFNGHTPFSAIVAFSAVLTAYLNGIDEVVLSNESSANEPTVEQYCGLEINHQYSKSFEFEQDFKCYVSKYLPFAANYYSLLRPYSELQIAWLFSKLGQKYWSVFKSCNVGLKQNKWCCNCPKCLFVYIILSPFLSETELTSIFGENLLLKKSLQETRKQLQGISANKPFECVGSKNEVNLALKNLKNAGSHSDEFMRELHNFDTENFVPAALKPILKEAIR